MDAVVVAVAAVDAWICLIGEPPAAVGASVVACGALVFRRRLPLAVFLLTLPAGLLLDVVFAPFAALFTHRRGTFRTGQPRTATTRSG